MARARKQHHAGKGRDHRDVEQDWRRGRRRKAADRVENAPVERHQCYQQQIREGDAGEFDGQRKAARILGKSRRKKRDDARREGERERQQ